MIPIGNVSWEAVPNPPYQSGVLSMLTPALIGSGVAHTRATVTLDFYLQNSWTYLSGDYRGQATFTTLVALTNDNLPPHSNEARNVCSILIALLLVMVAVPAGGRLRRALARRFAHPDRDDRGAGRRADQRHPDPQQRRRARAAARPSRGLVSRRGGHADLPPRGDRAATALLPGSSSPPPIF